MGTAHVQFEGAQLSASVVSSDCSYKYRIVNSKSYLGRVFVVHAKGELGWKLGEGAGDFSNTSVKLVPMLVQTDAQLMASASDIGAVRVQGKDADPHPWLALKRVSDWAYQLASD